MPSLAYRMYTTANAGLGVLERFAKTSSPAHPAIFIIGAPRCGSTLIYQAMVAEFGFSYLSNRHCQIFGAPWLIEKSSDALTQYRQSLSFSSKFGGTDGWYSPSECGNYWYRFFPKYPQFVSDKDFPQSKEKALKQSVSLFSRIAKRPILFKNLMNVLRLEPLLRVFPDALFVTIEREPLDIAHSILEARHKLYGNYNSWFSVEVPDMKDLQKESPEKQVTEQIRSVYQLLNIQKSRKPDQFTTLNYERFCAAPDQELQKLEGFFKSHSINAERALLLPNEFPLRKKVRIEEKLYFSLQNYLSKNPITL